MDLPCHCVQRPIIVHPVNYDPRQPISAVNVASLSLTESGMAIVDRDLSSTLHIFRRSDHIATQKIGSLAMMCRASSSGATVWPNGPTGAQRRFHSDQ